MAGAGDREPNFLSRAKAMACRLEPCHPTWQQQDVVQKAYHRDKVWNQVNWAAIERRACYTVCLNAGLLLITSEHM